MINTILTILGSSTVTAVVTTLINRKSLTIQNNKDNDAVLINRIEFLEKRLTRLEELACYNVDCKKRV